MNKLGGDDNLEDEKHWNDIYQKTKKDILEKYFQNDGILPDGALRSYISNHYVDFLSDAFDYGVKNLGINLSLSGNVKRKRDINGNFSDAVSLLENVIHKLSKIIVNQGDMRAVIFFYSKLRKYHPPGQGHIILSIATKICEEIENKENHALISWLESEEDGLTMTHKITYINFLDELINSLCFDEATNNYFIKIKNDFISKNSQFALIHFQKKPKQDTPLSGYLEESYNHFEAQQRLDEVQRGIKIAVDTVIQLDRAQRVPVYSYTIMEGQLGRKMPYENLYKDYQFLKSEEESGEDYSYLMQLLHIPHTLYKIETALGIRFDKYRFSIQPPFLRFLAYATLDDFARVKEFLSGADNDDDKYYRLRLFLATVEKPDEEKPEKTPIAEIILELEGKLIEAYSRDGKENGKQRGKEMAQLIFKKYSEVMDIIDKEAEKIQKSLISKVLITDNDSFKTEYSKLLLNRANDMVLREFDKETATQDSKSIDDLFGKCQTVLLQFGSLFRTIEEQKQEQRSLDEILPLYNVTKKTVKGADILQYKEMILSFYERHYRKKGYFVEMMKEDEQMIEDDANNPNTEFTLFFFETETLDKDNQITKQKILIQTIKFEEKDDGTVYAGTFNTDPMILKSTFGSLVMRSMLEKYNHKVVRGTVIEGNEKLIDYYSEFNFESDRKLGGKEGDAVRFYDIVRPIQNK